MEKRKRKMIRAAVRRMKNCILEEVPEAEELSQAFDVWKMWIDALQLEGLIGTIGRAEMLMELKDFREECARLGG